MMRLGPGFRTGAAFVVMSMGAMGCLFGGDDSSRFEQVHTGPREPDKTYLDKNEVHRCYIVMTSQPDDCDVVGVVDDKPTPVGRTPLRIVVDVREKQYSDGESKIRFERVNEMRSKKDIATRTGLDVDGWKELHVAYLFKKTGYLNKRIERTTLTPEQLLAQPEQTFAIHVELEPETLDVRQAAPTVDVNGDRWAYECDVRLVEVSSGRAARATTGRAVDPQDFRNMAQRIVFELTERLDIARHAKVAVLDLEEIGPETHAAQHGVLVARMISTDLINTGKFEVIERQQLDRLLVERDLTAAQIAASPGEMGKVLGLDYVVLGSVAKVR